jgi:two-component SAPR family response regulator
MNPKSLMVLHQAPEQLDRFVYLGAIHNLVLLHEATDALSFLKRIPVDVILLRDGLSGMDAMEFLMNLQDLHLSTYTIVLHQDPFPVNFPEMRNVCFLREPVSSYDLNQLISQLGSGTHTQKIHSD